MNELTSNLYISDAPSVRDLEDDHDFDLVVTLGYFDSFGYERPAASDTNDEYVFPDGPHDYNVFKTAVDRVLDALNDNQRVLVHCQAGVSRSAGVCTAVLAVQQNSAAPIALERVRNARPKVNPTDEVWASVERYVNNHFATP
jgi:protein-tyrosine phosphatase